MQLPQRLLNKCFISRVAVLNKRPLHLPFFEGLCCIDLFSGQGMHAGVVHAPGQGHGQRYKVLHLFRVHSPLDKVLREAQGIGKGRARMGADKIIHQVAFLFPPPVEALHFFDKLLIFSAGRLVHERKHPVNAMFRGHLHLSADVPAAQLFKIFCCPLIGQQVIAQTAADKRVVDAGKLADASQQLNAFIIITL